MADIRLVNTVLNNYFVNNKIEIKDSIPTTGTYNVGDIVIKATQVEHMAIGWICVEAGNPGKWSEFGGMFEEEEKPIELDPESVGMEELSNEVKAKIMLVENILTNVQILQNMVDDCATKDDLKNIDLSLYATKEDLKKIDLSDYATKTDLNNTKSELSTSITAVNNNITALYSLSDSQSATMGKLSSLSTTNKNSLVDAINEVFQSGVNVKKQLVDMLTSKGVEGVSTSNTFDELFTRCEDELYYARQEWTVQHIGGYQFTLNSSGYYVSGNKNVSSSYSVCKVTFTNPGRKTVYVDYISSGESSYDFGLISKLNTTLTSSTSSDSASNCIYHGSGNHSTAVRTVNFGTVAEGFFYVKYLKDGSVNTEPDSIQFKVRFA